MTRRPLAGACAAGLLLATAAVARVARGDDPAAGPRSVLVFSIAKSTNKNQVQYVVDVDERCAPRPGGPVHAYWRMLEQGPAAVAPILDREVPAYGLTGQQVTIIGPEGGSVRMALKAMPDRTIVVDTMRGPGGQCRALSTATIAGAPAHLFNVYAHITWLSGVDYLLLQGWSMDGKQVLRERVNR